MKVILSIGGAQWVADSAAVAAKICDLIGTCKPIKHIYDAGSEPMVFFEKPDYSHEISLKQISAKMLITSSEAKVRELIKAHNEIGEGK